MKNQSAIIAAKKRKRRRKYFFKRLLVIFLICALVVAAVTGTVRALKHIKNKFFSGCSQEFPQTADGNLNLKTLTPPEYVDVQIITNSSARSRVKISRVNDIVVHYTANPKSSAQNNHDYFDTPGTDVCSHFVVGINGEIIQCLPLDEKSAASNGRNKDTISIEVCHSDKTGEFSDKAYDSLVKLTAWLCDNAEISAEHIIRHYDVTGKECPLYYVERPDKWEDFKSDVKKAIPS